jgi:acetoin utilization deacetylase AcuC-like enzyme
MDDLVLYYSQGHEKHFEPGHPERPERLEVIRQALQAQGIWDACPHLEPIPLSNEFLSTVHTPAYLAGLQAACNQGARLDMDTYTTCDSWNLALNAAGGAAAVAQAVWSGKARRGLALTRPPGHHATSSRGMGFCLLNNIAIAAQYLIQQPAGEAPAAERLAIVDLDLHHGNGTEEIFYTRSDVFYLSTHQSPLYPGSGFVDEIGEGPGKGYTANFPLPPGTGDRGFQTVMDELILPLLDRYSPQMLLVSVGFDVHWRDPLGSLELSAAGYYDLIASLAGWCDRDCQGRIALVLEGGYDLQAGEACALAWVAALLGQPFADPLGPSPHPERSQWNLTVNAAHQVWDQG